MARIGPQRHKEKAQSLYFRFVGALWFRNAPSPSGKIFCTADLRNC